MHVTVLTITVILDLTPGFNRLGKDNCQTRRDSFKFCDLVRLILETLRYLHTLYWIMKEIGARFKLKLFENKWEWMQMTKQSSTRN